MKTTITIFLTNFLYFIGVQAQTIGWSPTAVSSFQKIRQTAISSNGNLVAYTLASPVTKADSSLAWRQHIWLAKTDGSWNRQFTQGLASCVQPRFSPDGAHLAFLSNRGGNNARLWRIPVDGGEARPVTPTEMDVKGFEWSPDGKSFAFTSVVLDSGYCHLFMISSELGSPIASGLTVGALHTTSLTGNGFSWAPDGFSIAFEHWNTPEMTAWKSANIAIVDLRSRKVKSVIDRTGYDGQPLFSGNGKKLAFVSDGGDSQWRGAMDLYTIPVKGGVAQRLAITETRQPKLIGWAQGNKAIFFSELSNAARKIFSISPSGKAAALFSIEDKSFDVVSISQNGKYMAFTTQTSKAKPQVIVTATSKYKPSQTTLVNNKFPRWQMGRTEEFSWWTEDSLNLNGLLTYPVLYDFDRLYPMVAIIEDGSINDYSLQFTAQPSVSPIQAFAEAGFFVFVVGSRGSLGYPVRYRRELTGNLGHLDAKDILTGIDHVLDNKNVHPDSLTLIGKGYGGYLTARILTVESRFKAACLVDPITDLVSFMGTSVFPDPVSDYLDQDISAYLKDAPIEKVKNISTPLFFLHGENNYRIPLTQTRQLFSALQKNEKTTKLLTYPGSLYGEINPDAMMALGDSVLNWLKLHIGRSKSSIPLN